MKMTNIPSKVYVGDFETRAGGKAIAENKTWVWAWALCCIEDPDDVKTGTSMDSFMRYIKVNLRNGSTIYFHNAKFDFKFILDWLYRNAFTLVDTAKGLRQFSTLISDQGQFYALDIAFTAGVVIRFQDSFKKLPFGVAKIGKDFKTKHQKGKIDYVQERLPNMPLSEEDREYVIDDVRVVAEALKLMYDEGHGRMTIGSDCLNEYIAICGGKKKFREKFPILSEGEDEFIRRSYRGGWCYTHRPGRWKNGSTYDVNSLYPSMMHSMSGNMYPYGAGIYYSGEYEKNNDYPLYVAHVIADIKLKNNHLPTVQLKNTGRFADNEYIEDTKGPVEMYLTCIDLEMMHRQYNVRSIEYIDGYMYRGHAGFFDRYIDKWMEVKMTSTGAMRALAKLFLNNLYGKFGQRLEGGEKIPWYDDDAEIVRYKTGPCEKRKTIYIPVATFCTAYSRRFTITAAQKNYDIFCYADTDSIHCDGKVVGIDVDDKKLCCWKHESDWDDGIFVRQKTYMEHIKTNSGYEWEIKCAGMNQDTKDVFLNGMKEGKYVPDDFAPGLCIEGYKLRPKTVRGGVVLCPTKFEIKT